MNKSFKLEGSVIYSIDVSDETVREKIRPSIVRYLVKNLSDGFEMVTVTTPSPEEASSLIPEIEVKNLRDEEALEFLQKELRAPDWVTWDYGGRKGVANIISQHFPGAKVIKNGVR